ncbi:MAG TPA: methylenetetrahydrofolate reductase C-terminal domain-containing protein [Candidatus Methanoperedens sp.]
MIISRQKEMSELLREAREENIFIIGCGKCAAKLHVGGEPEVLNMKKVLVSAGKNIVGWMVLSSACSISSWDEVISQNPAIKKADALLVMSCGGGVSVISGFSDLQVYPALDTESLGGVCRDEIRDELCGLCGECAVWEYGGICPVSKCPKGLSNGPCGGAMEGKCEVDGRDCAWDGIYNRLKRLGKLENITRIYPPRDHSIKLRRKKS